MQKHTYLMWRRCTDSINIADTNADTLRCAEAGADSSKCTDADTNS